MKITVVGAGYVGLSLATLMSKHNKVVLLDIDQNKIAKIKDKISKNNIKIVSDIDIFMKNYKSKVIAITGSNGKTTVTELLNYVLNKLNYKSVSCGNNGIPILSIEHCKYDYICLEVSSYQLEISGNINSDVAFLKKYSKYPSLFVFTYSFLKYPLLKLHMIGKLQTNKVKEAMKLFNVIHSIDREKLILKISNEAQKIGFCPKLFIQVNTGNENQKAGVIIDEVDYILELAKVKHSLPIVGLMCLPPIHAVSYTHLRAHET